MITLIKRYDDKNLARQAERTLASDPSIDNSAITVYSKNGIVTLEGQVRNRSEHQQVLNAVQRAFDRMNLKYDRVADMIVES